MTKKETFVINGETAFTLNQAAKLLNFEIGRTNLMMLFRNWGILLKNNAPSQSMIKRGYMLYWLKAIEKDGKPFKRIPVTLVTIEGLAYLKKLIHRNLKREKNDRFKEETSLCDDSGRSAGVES